MSVGALIEFYFKLIICITITEEPFLFLLAYYMRSLSKASINIYSGDIITSISRILKPLLIAL
ncbi:hypothetical protein MICAE_360044 [Microcystis aeruginosa PCC 9806]|uniref:Uncharacterized protein n=2 Tax=Microcystis TaxID=1125 RepID=A0A552LSC8_9CHRO|nr:MAG: hypothetical protein EWV40_08675 [Microcystis flos-aquae Mf_WU_F_19750830_S460]CCI14654.1 hypothetical protein MICAE_360044 [Microcystis aeruginosa PCC 9806]